MCRKLTGAAAVTPRRASWYVHDMTRRTLSIIAAGAFCVQSGCNSDSSTSPTSGPTDVAVVDSVEYTAVASELGAADGVARFIVVVTLHNLSTSASVSRSWPAGCPVRIQLLRTIDSLLVYDETKLPCALPGLTTISIRPRDRLSLGSGSRAMTAVAGDSIDYGTYRVVAVPQIEGARVIRLEAGLLNLRALP